PDVPGHCCTMPWSSKGFRAGHERMARRMAGSLRRWSDDGALPVVIDAASCTHGVHTEVEGLDGIEVLDAVAWAHDRLLPALEIALEQATGRPYESVVALLERATR